MELDKRDHILDNWDNMIEKTIDAKVIASVKKR